VTLILEVKGFHGEKEDHKFQAAKRWVSAVNNWGRMGRWDFHVGRNLDALQTEIESLNQRSIG
jgi:type III restriction enzyme